MRSPVDHYSDAWLSFELRHPVDRLRLLAGMVPEDLYSVRRVEINRKVRDISNPCDELKAVQRSIRERLLLPIPLSPIVYSDVPGHSAAQNAERHLHQANVGSADIRDCYNSMTNAMVFRVFRHTLRLGDSLADLLTGLTTSRGHLPHGAPTSGALANLILSPIDVELERIAVELDLKITRYVDNIDFSGQRTRHAFLPIVALIQSLGFAVKRRKVFNASRQRVQIVTGRTVSGRVLRLPRAKRANVRANVHEVLCRRRDGLPIQDKQINRLRGRLNYLRTQGHPKEARDLATRLAAVGINI
ncbi:MAG: RNA-directed DNA polymerase [Acidobacteria bacterium]|nr:RNA-directed DNA polymerase [Acidobacteriota bacterium]